MNRRLSFAAIAQGREFHAALVELSGKGANSGPAHSHDFWESMLVLEGVGEHHCGERCWQIQPGTLLLLRPPDCHSVVNNAGGRLLFINVAFPQDTWRSFCSAAGLEAEYEAWCGANAPLLVQMGKAGRKRCAQDFWDVLWAFDTSPRRLELCRFLSAVTGRFAPSDSDAGTGGESGGTWLDDALLQMHEPENLRRGLHRLQELSGVSAAHLARTFRRRFAQSPTDFVNGLRLERAALLLNTTTQPIIDIAHDCGFENLSYFYRLFRNRYGRPPRAFRAAGRGSTGQSEASGR